VKEAAKGSLSGRLRAAVRRRVRRVAGAASRLPLLNRLSCLRAAAALGRELRVVCRGMAQWRAGSVEAVAYRLRRNIHRLEKGLTMPHRRRRFATGYIAQTVADLETLARRMEEGQCQRFGADIQWATDVLAAYFAAVQEDAVTEGARRRFADLRRAAGLEPSGPVTIPAAERPEPGLTPEQFRQLVARRRSVRWFLPRRVDRARIEWALEAARTAPSACNRQPIRYIVVDEPSAAVRCASLLMGAEGYAAGVPAVAVIAGRWRAFEDARDRHLPYLDAGLSAMLFLLALEVQGLGGCCVNCPDLPGQTARLMHFLGLEPDEQPLLAVVFGHPDPAVRLGRADRRSAEAFRSYWAPCT